MGQNLNTIKNLSAEKSELNQDPKERRVQFLKLGTQRNQTLFFVPKNRKFFLFMII